MVPKLVAQQGAIQSKGQWLFPRRPVTRIFLSRFSKSFSLRIRRQGKQKAASEVNSESTLLHLEIARRTEAFRTTGKSTTRGSGDLARAARRQLLRPPGLGSVSLPAP